MNGHDKPRDLFDAEGDFDTQLKSARRKLEGRSASSWMWSARLDAAKLGENIDIDSEVE